MKHLTHLQASKEITIYNEFVNQGIIDKNNTQSIDRAISDAKRKQNEKKRM